MHGNKFIIAAADDNCADSPENKTMTSLLNSRKDPLPIKILCKN